MRLLSNIKIVILLWADKENGITLIRYGMAIDHMTSLPPQDKDKFVVIVIMFWMCPGAGFKF